MDVTDFNQQVLERSRTIPVLVDFWADWCGPCRMLGPVLERLAEEEGAYAEPRWELAKVDTEKLREVSARYGIRSIPNVKLFIDGEPVDEFTGALPEASIRRWLERALPSPNDALIEDAGRLIAAGEMAEGRKILDQVIANEPENHLAALLMAQSWLAEDPEKGAVYVEHIHEDSPLFDRAEAIRIVARLRHVVQDPSILEESEMKEKLLEGARATLARDFDTALSSFIEVIREDRYYADDLARQACIAIFRVLGESHEITRRHRRAFDGALYV